METAILITLLLTLFLVFVEDLLTKSLYWFWFPILFILCGLHFSLSHNLEGMLKNVFLNSLYIILIITLSYFIQRAIFKRKAFINESLGFGDILFYISISPLFRLEYLIIISSFSFLFILSFCITSIIKKRELLIPLAGIQAIIIAGVLFTEEFIFLKSIDSWEIL